MISFHADYDGADTGRVYKQGVEFGLTMVAAGWACVDKEAPKAPVFQNMYVSVPIHPT